jgi:hypothetical protein
MWLAGRKGTDLLDYSQAKFNEVAKVAEWPRTENIELRSTR